MRFIDGRTQITVGYLGVVRVVPMALRSEAKEVSHGK